MPLAGFFYPVSVLDGYNLSYLCLGGCEAALRAAFRYQWLLQRLRMNKETLRGQRALAMTRSRYPQGELCPAMRAALDGGPDDELPAYRINGSIGPFIIWAN